MAPALGLVKHLLMFARERRPGPAEGVGEVVPPPMAPALGLVKHLLMFGRERRQGIASGVVCVDRRAWWRAPLRRLRLLWPCALVECGELAIDVANRRRRVE